MFWKNDDEQDEKIAHNFNQAIENLSDRKTLRRLLIVLFTADIIIWLAIIIFPQIIYEKFGNLFDLNNKLGAAILGVPFGIGLFITYSLFRCKFPDIEEQNLESNLMASYDYQNKSLKRWWIWLFSVIGGILNLLFLMLTDLYLSGGL